MGRPIYKLGNTTVTLHFGDLPQPNDGARASELENVLTALEYVDALNALGVDGAAPPADGAARQLVAELSEALARAADQTSDAAFSQHLRLRSAAVDSGRFEQAATFCAERETAFELVLGPSPEWTHPTQSGAYTATLARRAQEWGAASIKGIDSAVDRRSRELLDDAGAWPVERAFDPPLYSVCDLLAVAGEAAVPPLHFAAFLPEDEGKLGVTTKTVVYRNFYEFRFRTISVPLFGKVALNGAASMGDEAFGEAGTTLIKWLRGHDMGHSYFDTVCRKAGLSPQTLHATREVIADSLGDVAALTDIGTLADGDAIARVLLAEKLRYARRPAEVFADSLAARVELGWLMRTSSLRDVGAEDLLRSSNALLEAALGHLTRSDTAAFEVWLERVARNFVWPVIELPPPDDAVPAFPGRAVRRTRSRARERVRGCLHV